MSEPHAPAALLPAELLTRLVGAQGSSALDAIDSVAVPLTEIEDFRPLGECLEWRLADAFWDHAGVIPFVRNDVPHLVNNSGRLSDSAAALVFAALEEMRPSLPARIVVLELGAGTGLYARYFLDAFKACCRQQGSDLYQRLTYVVTDRFPRTVAGWQRDGLFAGHDEHVDLRTCDASMPWALFGAGDAPALDAPVVVFCNYLLDVLPSRIVRRSGTQLEQLCVRTHLPGGDQALQSLSQSSGLASVAEARALAASGQFADLRRLLALLPHLELETTFRSWVPATPGETAFAAAMVEGERVILNHGALACLDQLIPQLDPCALLLINDYGPVRSEDVGSHLGVQRFGGSVALGLNFPWLERALAERGFTCAVPTGDDQRRIHTRLCARTVGASARAVLHASFGLDHDQALDAPRDEARAHLAAGRRNEALDAYRRLIERNPGDWQMLGEAAEYIGLQLGDHAAGLQIVRAALERNPWCSAWLWNVLGDCLFYRNRLADAHAAFTQAQRIDPDDPRSNLNLAYTLSAQDDQPGALAAIARGLAGDRHGHFRPRLLEKQGQVLTLLADRTAADKARLARRAQRFA
jgi:tetratricopeptide (TPR) repeat protein